ncbi:hypothetical protein JHD50_11150 [Sulfurimonas sp. MAG313]|nr:hypothetical protein [Sulfurimonas sp. MAG313]MDF1881848.1 hypothetical protein [Sulfurimonas sp. MAG313]
MNIYTQTPIPPNKQCKLLQIALALFLSYGIYLITAIIWFFYNWYYALSSLLLSFVLMGIVRSKLLHASIPKVQQEFTYSDKDISSWYVHRYVCPSEVE